MEVSSVLASRGVETTMLIRDDRMWKAFFTPEMSAFFRKYYVDHGVRVLTQTSAAAIESESSVRLTTGESRLSTCSLPAWSGARHGSGCAGRPEDRQRYRRQRIPRNRPYRYSGCRRRRKLSGRDLREQTTAGGTLGQRCVAGAARRAGTARPAGGFRTCTVLFL